MLIPDDDVLIVDGYLDAERCALVVDEFDFVLWRDSQVVRAGVDGGLISFRSDERTSRSTTQKWFSAALNAELAVLESRLETDFGPAPRYLEEWQAVRYQPGARFGLHTDGGLFADDPAGERVITFLFYVQAPAAGGETYFPRLGRLVDPVAGRLVAWRNLSADGTVNARFLHAATPVRTGSKTVLTTWSRQRPARPAAGDR